MTSPDAHITAGATDIAERVRAAFPRLVTERLALRVARQSDFDAYAAFRGSDHARFVGGPSTPREAYLRLGLETGMWALRGYGSFIIADRDSDAPMGLGGFYHHADWPGAEMGWGLFKEFEGRGFATEAGRALCRFAFDTLGWASVTCSVNDENTRSIALIERLGGMLGPDRKSDGSRMYRITPETAT